MNTRIWLGAAFAFIFTTSSSNADVQRSWAIAEFGEPKFNESMTHWPYANPDAPRGGKIVSGAFGTFDSLSWFLLKGNPAGSIGLTIDSLMTRSSDDLLGRYGLIAEAVEYPDDISWAIFDIHPKARYSDGVAITAQDFKLSFDTIREHGRPFLRSFYRDVESVEVLSERRVKFTFSTRNNMKTLINVAGMTPMPSHYWKDRNIAETTLEPWPSSGPYKVKELEAGRYIVYERVEDYWANELPARKGLFNFDEIRYDYYRDFGVIFEAFKSGDIDFRAENQSKRWATEYEFPAINKGLVKRELLPDRSPQGIQGLLMNTRRAKFSDPRVREGLGLLFDFEWTKKALLFNQYTRTNSYFPNSDYGASGKPKPEELAILNPFKDELPKAVFEKAFEPSKTDGSGRIRSQLRQALRLFKAAGWRVKGGKLVDAAGQQMSIEILLVQPDFERLLSPYIENLKRAGINAALRIVDTSQYENRTDNFDFDMINIRFNFFPPPGAELRSFYGSKGADEPGTANMAGIRIDAVDKIVEQVISAPDLDTLKVYTRALDRILLFGHYIIPQWHNAHYRIAYWDRFARPERAATYGTGFPQTWWIDESLDAKLTQIKR